MYLKGKVRSHRMHIFLCQLLKLLIKPMVMAARQLLLPEECHINGSLHVSRMMGLLQGTK